MRALKFSRGIAPLVPYAACFVATWGLIGLESRLRIGVIAVAFVLQVLVGVLLVVARDGDRGRLASGVAIVAFLASVVLLRAGVGSTPSYGVLVLLPIVWASLRGRRGELAMAIVGAAIVLFVPIVVAGSGRYAPSGWRTGGLLVVVAAVVGITVRTLVDWLRASEVRYRLLAHNATDLVTCLAVDGTITYASPAAHGLLGFAPDELVGQHALALMHPADHALHTRAAIRMDSDEQTTVLECRLRHRDGRWVWCEATARAIRGRDGVVCERQAAIRSIEDRKRLQLTVERQRDDARETLATQRALQTIATLVATGAPPAAVFGAVATQVAGLFDGVLGGVVRFDGPAATGEIVGGWSADGSDITGETVDLGGPSAAARVYRTGAGVQVAAYEARAGEPILERFAPGGALCAPIIVGARLWGSVGVAVATDTPMPARAQQRLSAFGELVAVAIANAQARETLTHQAATDPITGLANQRTFHERLRHEVQCAAHHHRALSLVLFDLDHFKAVNDTHGHQTGDDVLAAVAERLSAVARTNDLVARIGGEEFAWLMPESTQDGAYLAAERARHAICDTPFPRAGALTTSVGVCSIHHATSAHELLAGADAALYSAKTSGRNVTRVYHDDTRPIRAQHLSTRPEDPTGGAAVAPTHPQEREAARAVRT